MKEGSRRLRVAIVGAGYVCRHHIRALQTLKFVEVVAIVDVDVQAAEKVSKEFNIPKVLRDVVELAALSIDAVYVLTPPATHCEIALKAIDSGCHVFVEKPMAQTVAECDAMIKAAEEKGVVLSVNHSDRLDPVVLKALEKIRRGTCGDLISVDFLRGSEYAPYAGGPRYGAYAKGSYPFQDLGVHGLYLLEAFLGQINELHVEYHKRGDDPNFLFDDWYGHAQCEKGIGRMHISWVSRPMQSRLIIQGTRGTIEVDRFLQTVVVTRDMPGPKFIGMVLNAVIGSIHRAFSVGVNVLRFALKRLRPSPGIFAGARDFAESVFMGRKPLVLAEEGRRMVALMAPVSNKADKEADSVYAKRLKKLPRADVLVTGAGGFLGGSLLRRLVQEGKTVRAMVRRSGSVVEKISGVQIVIGDLGDPEIVDHAVQGVDVVYHLGAAMRGGPESFRAGTTVAVKNVIDSCLRHAIKRLVYVSSLSVLQHANREDDLVINEDSPYERLPEKRGLYTQTKLQAEQAVLGAIKEHGLPAVILRPGQIFGPGAEATTPNGVIGIAGRWLLVGDGRARLPLVYVDDVVDALLLAEEQDGVIGKLFNVVDGTPITQNDYLARLAKSDGFNPRVWRVPEPIMLVLAFGVEALGKAIKRDVPLTRYRVRSLQPLTNFDLSAAKDVLNWTPKSGSLAGLEKTFGRSENTRKSD